MTDLAQERILNLWIVQYHLTIHKLVARLWVWHVVTNAKMHSDSEHNIMLFPRPSFCFCIWLGYKQVATLTYSHLVDFRENPAYTAFIPAWHAE